MAVSLSTNIAIVCAVFTALPIIAVVLRFWARTIKHNGLAADDYLILPGLLFSVGLSVNNIVAVALGNLGGHIHTDDAGNIVFDDTLTIFLQTEFATQLLSVLSLVFTKLSIVVFYRRIFRGKVFSIISSILLGVVAAWGVAFFFATLFECMPIPMVWKTLFGTPDHQAVCYNYLPMFWATAISNMIIDVVILALPMPFVWRLNMPRRQRAAVSAIFLLGAFVVGISIARIHFFFLSSDSYANAMDITVNIAPTLYWTVIEAAIAVVSACLPTLRPLFAGISLEALQDFASKFSIRSGNKSSASLASNNPRTAAADSKWQLSFPNHSAASSARIMNRVEAVRLPSSEDAPLELRDQSGILVSKAIHQHRQDA
ncbi:hypothetical protein C8A01DRAFT_34028 [Parachaetomium inaequale]|uniref:Rhodopsin domain-containing protein n=1 Tax=Parachaetomium inaequale TaxID=2588326 RepID=A0AAN6PJA4_9PEZI|nr:hypothetical protein C8A01DRAFT_34028 [Parachaetomium inaequale]